MSLMQENKEPYSAVHMWQYYTVLTCGGQEALLHKGGKALGVPHWIAVEAQVPERPEGSNDHQTMKAQEFQV